MKTGRLFFIVALFFIGKLFSSGLAVKGNYRIRGNSFRNLHFSDGTKYRNYIDHRFRLNAVFIANDYVLIKSDLDFFGNCGNYNGSSVGCFLGHNTPDSNANSLNYPIMNRWAGQATNSIYAKRLWIELNTKYGILRAGRIPDSWGLGIYANSGDGVWDNYGDSLDRIIFDMKYGAVTFSPFYGNYSEQELDSTNDIYELGFKLKYNMVDTKNIYGFYLALRSSRDEENRLASYDLFADHSFGLLRLELELVFQNGKTLGNNIDATGMLARLSSKFSGAFKTALEFGSASGDSEPAVGDVKDFSFNPDYRPALILFAHESGQDPYRLLSADGTYSYPSTVTNAIYVKPTLSFTHGRSTWEGSFIWAQKQHKDLRSQERALGYEIDLAYGFRSSEILRYGVDLGFLLPGEYFKYNDDNKDLKFATYLGAKFGVSF